MNLNHWGDGVWADGSWVPSVWGSTAPTPTNTDGVDGAGDAVKSFGRYEQQKRLWMDRHDDDKIILNVISKFLEEFQQ